MPIKKSPPQVLLKRCRYRHEQAVKLLREAERMLTSDLVFIAGSQLQQELMSLQKRIRFHLENV